MTRVHLLSIVLYLTFSIAQFPPVPENITTIKSKFHPGIKISYKQEPGICETTPGVRSYSGYVHLPPNALNEGFEDQSYPINTFFWFFEARKDPQNAPLTIWLNGGPGGSSLFGALVENGPCFVGNDSNSTYPNPWSWNNDVNMLYIDQPNQVGYSYDTLTNVTVNLKGDRFFDMSIKPADFSDGVPEQNLTFVVGTTGSQNYSHTANSTTHAATAIWHFAQTWFEEFPHYKPKDEKVSLFTESYGGHYGPAMVAYFMRQNELIKNGSISNEGAHYLRMDTLGIINGCIDGESQFPTWATFARNNTYGIEAMSESDYYHAMYELNRPGGILDMVRECQRLQRKLDPDDHGDVQRVNEYCASTNEKVDNVTTGVYLAAEMAGWFDISHPATDSFPPAYAMGFLNQNWVQKALGVPVNHSFVSQSVALGFGGTGDMARGGLVEDMAYILDRGVRVAMLYGDRDYACNWVGGEAASLKVPYHHQDDFAAAGYTPLVISSVHSGGLTRQYGNFSFTRVYQAGHMVPSYQPQAAYEIFVRAITGRDIATGTLDIDEIAAKGEQYSTDGPSDTWWMKSEILPSPPRECYIWAMGRCSEEEERWIMDGTALVKDWIVLGRQQTKTSARIPNSNLQLPLIGDW